jgi:hypothetical protein
LVTAQRARLARLASRWSRELATKRFANSAGQATAAAA